MILGKKRRLFKGAAGALLVSLILLGWLSCGGENKNSPPGSISLQIILPEGGSGNGTGSAGFAKVNNWTLIQCLEIFAYIVEGGNYLDPIQVGYFDLKNPGTAPYVDLEVAVFGAAKVYFVAHAYQGVGPFEAERYRGYAVVIIDPAADNVVTVMMMPDWDHDHTFARNPAIDYSDRFFTEPDAHYPDCNDFNPHQYPGRYYDTGYHPNCDCERNNPGVFPESETPSNGSSCSDLDDNDCDGLVDGADPSCSVGAACNDIDQDGYGSPASPQCESPLEDCNDRNDEVNPGAIEDFYYQDSETCYDEVDNDCDGLTDSADPDCPQVPCSDYDEDGYGTPASPECEFPEADCDDTNYYANPGLTEDYAEGESCNDEADNDCDGLIDGRDPDCE